MNTNDISFPFNFSRYSGDHPEYNSIKTRKQYTWIYDAKLPYNYDYDQVVEDLLNANKAILIDGCDESFAVRLKSLGFEIIEIGKEAVLEIGFDHFSKKSLKELVRRGSNKGNFREVMFTEENTERLKTFISECTHGNEPQLKYLFNDTFMVHNRLFVLEKEGGSWLGAILISDKEHDYAKTDLILRRKYASVGIMESLIYSIFGELKEENYKYWSLGAVPFIVYQSNLFTKEGIINYTGRRLKFAYNYEGLFNFKNKFNPVWQDYYFCFKPKLNLWLLINILRRTNLLKLIVYKSKR